MKAVTLLLMLCIPCAAQVSDMQIADPINRSIPSFFELRQIANARQTVDGDVYTVKAVCQVTAVHKAMKDGEEPIPEGTKLDIPVELTFKKDGVFYKFESMKSEFPRYSERGLKMAVDADRTRPADGKKAPGTKPSPPPAATDTETTEGTTDARTTLLQMCRPNTAYIGTITERSAGVFKINLRFTKLDEKLDLVEAELFDNSQKFAIRKFTGTIQAKSITLTAEGSKPKIAQGAKVTFLVNSTADLILTPNEDGSFSGRAGRAGSVYEREYPVSLKNVAQVAP